MLRKLRLNAKILWLAFQVRRHTRKVRAMKVRVQALGMKYGKVDSDLLAQIQILNKDDAQLQGALRLLKNHAAIKSNWLLGIKS